MGNCAADVVSANECCCEDRHLRHLEPEELPFPIPFGIDTDEHSPVYAKRALTAYGDSDVSDVSEYLQLLCDLEGLWYDRKNNNLMCHIREGVLIWMWPCQVAGEVRAMPPNTIQLELDDHIHIGVFTADAQASIVWNDGDIWLRK
mmetsp:Transcript_31185/g.73240  ORF Transcript_31185/g.73240 Transcript_31185/m.73240 type:complete len:146 (-) Transcript_31185:236-673(-)